MTLPCLPQLRLAASSFEPELTEPTTTDELLHTAGQALERAARPGVRASSYTLVVAVAELGAWLTDERQSSRARRTNWDSLIDDLLRSLRKIGPALGNVVERDVREREFRAIKRALPSREGLDAATRRRLFVIWRDLDEVTGTAEARTAALDDLIDGARGGFERALDTAVTLIALGDVPAGRDDWFARRLRNALQDDREAPLAPQERVERARELLAAEVVQGQYVVWLRIDYAPLNPLGLLELGPSVCLFSVARLRSALERDDEPVFARAPELRNDADEMDFLLGSEGNDDNEEPALLIRVSFGSETGPRARERAFATAETIAGLACLHGAHPGTWIVGDSFASYVDDRRGAASINADEHRRIPAYPALALQGDRTAHALSAMAEELGAKLPVIDGELAEAGQLLHWLQQARAATPAARVLLYDRILEQVAGWAGVGETERFIADYLRPHLLRRRLWDEVAEAAFGAHYILLHEPEAAEVLRPWCEPRNLNGRGDLPAFLASLEEVREAVEQSDSVWRWENPLTLVRLRRLSEVEKSSNKRRRWRRELEHDFEHNEERRRRTRNSLVHGGPLSEATIGTIAPFSERLTTNALAIAIEGRLSSAELIDHFLTVARSDSGVLERFDTGATLADALFGSA